MRPVTRKPRLDEILLRQGRIGQQEIQDALLRQKAHGGKFGSQLLYHRFIDEAALVDALAAQLSCEGVVLSGLQIPDTVVKLVPKKVALARKVLPFAYDQAGNLLQIACEDPTDPTLINELGFLTSGKKIKLYVAAELALNTAIARYYLGREISLDDSLLLELPDITADVAQAPAAIGTPPARPVPRSPAALLVTDEAYAAPLLQSLLERDGCRTLVTDSVEQALTALAEEQFSTVFVRAPLVANVQEFADRVRRITPQTRVQAYTTVSSLLLGGDTTARDADLLLRNLDLFTALLSGRASRPGNHSGRVGRYADAVCHKLGLTVKDRMLITTAAYVHDLAWFYGHAQEATENRQVVERTIQLLASLDYLPDVLEILHGMYQELPAAAAESLPLEVLGGNILTVVDLYCESTPPDERFSADTVDTVKRRLRDEVGRLFLPDVVEAFIEIMQEEILDWHISRRASQVMIYADDLPLQQLLELLARKEGYRTVAHHSADAFIELYRRSTPDLLILGIRGDPAAIIALVCRLAEGGIDFHRTPTFLMADTDSAAELDSLRDRGIKDIIPLDCSLDRLTGEIRALQSRLAADNSDPWAATGSSGAHGRFTDMNLIDLLQALGPSRKTVRIIVQPTRQGVGPLTVYLDQGTITFARWDHLTGAEAVYEALTWTDGSWTVEAAAPSELPPTNSTSSNESLLMEGCRRLDERVKSGQLL